MSESELYQIDGLGEDMQKLRAVRQKILELWLEVSDQEYVTVQAEDVHDEACDMLRAAAEHIMALTSAQALTADPSTDYGIVGVTHQ